MIRYLKLYYRFFTYSLHEAMIYRANFIAWGLVSIGWCIFTLLFYQLLFTHIDTIAGWTKGEVFLLQGFWFLIDAAFWGLFYTNLWELPRKINKGTLDLELAKPINKQFLLS